MRRPLPALLLLLPLVGVTGCSLGLASSRLVSATQAVREAESRGAAELAPYEYTLARQHLDMALEQAADAHFKDSMMLADEAKLQADAAITRMSGGGRDLQELNQRVEELSDDPLSLDEEGPAETPTSDDAAPETPPPERKKDDFDDFVDDEDPLWDDE